MSSADENNEEWVTTKAGLMAHIGRNWGALTALLDAFTDEEWVTLTNAAGWTIKDIVAHLTAWERSIIAVLKKQPRHEGIGLPRTLFESGDVDAINAALLAKHRHDPLEEVRARFHATHAEALTLLDTLTDEDLYIPYNEYLPHDAGPDDVFPVLVILYGNTAAHYSEHHQMLLKMLPGT